MQTAYNKYQSTETALALLTSSSPLAAVDGVDHELDIRIEMIRFLPSSCKSLLVQQILDLQPTETVVFVSFEPATIYNQMTHKCMLSSNRGKLKQQSSILIIV